MAKYTFEIGRTTALVDERRISELCIEPRKMQSPQRLGYCMNNVNLVNQVNLADGHYATEKASESESGVAAGSLSRRLKRDAP